MLAAEFPDALNDLPKNSRGDLDPTALVNSETLGLISITSLFLIPSTSFICVA